MLGNALPLIAISLMTLKKEPLLLFGPGGLINLRVQVVMPSAIVRCLPFSALFASSAGRPEVIEHPLTNLAPVVCPMFFDKGRNGVILLR